MRTGGVHSIIQAEAASWLGLTQVLDLSLEDFVEVEAIAAHARRLIEDSTTVRSNDSAKLKGLVARALSLLHTFGGAKNPFASQLEKLSPSPEYGAKVVGEVLEAFIVHLEAGLVGGLSPKRQAEIDVVSDLLEQAHGLLENSRVHAAAPAVLIGATLEEFLRTWLEDVGLSLGGKNPSIDAYMKVLRENELISKQDVKDITSWAGIRNHAAHGEWSEVGDKARVRLMLDGVNLFLRTYTRR